MINKRHPDWQYLGGVHVNYTLKRRVYLNEDYRRTWRVAVLDEQGYGREVRNAQGNTLRFRSRERAFAYAETGASK